MAVPVCENAGQHAVAVAAVMECAYWERDPVAVIKTVR